MANDIDIIVGVKDIATAVLERIAAKADSIGGNSKLAFAGAAERLNDQLARASSFAGSGSSGGANNDKLAKAIEQAANGLSTKLDAALAKTNTAIDRVVGKVNSAVGSVTRFVTKAATVATVGAAFVTVGRAVGGVAGGLGLIPSKLQGVNQGLAGSIGKFVVATGAAVALAQATQKATSSTTGMIGKVTAVGQGALAVFVLRNAMKKTEDGASTMTAKIAKVAGTGLAFAVVSKSVLGLGMNLLGVNKAAAAASTALSKTANAAKSIGSKVTAAPFNALKTGAIAASTAALTFASSMEDLPSGAQTLSAISNGFNSVTVSLQHTLSVAAQGVPILGGVASALVGIPAAFAGIGLAALVAADKTRWQLEQLTNKLKLVEAAKLNISIDLIDTAPLRKIAEETERTAKRIQLATNVQSSKLISLATSSLAKGLDSSQLGEAMKAAVGLGEVYGTGIEDGMYRARQAIDGNFEAFEKLIPKIKTMTNAQDKLAAVSRLASNGFKVLQAESSNLWGTIERVKNGFGNTLEAIGQFKSLSEVVGTVLRDVVTPAIAGLAAPLKGLGFDSDKLLAGAKSIGAGVIAAIETIRSNWDLVWQRIGLSNELFWEKLTNQSVHFATKVIPWMCLQVEDVIVRAMNRVVDSVTATVAKVASIFGTTIKTTPTPEPKPIAPVPARWIPGQEALLGMRIKATDAQLGLSFLSNLGKANLALGDALKDKKGIADVALQAGPGAKSIAAAEIATKKRMDYQPLQAFESRLLTRGPANDPQMQMVSHLKEIRRQNQKAHAIAQEDVEWLKKLAERPGFNVKVIN